MRSQFLFETVLTCMSGSLICFAPSLSFLRTRQPLSNSLPGIFPANPVLLFCCRLNLQFRQVSFFVHFSQKRVENEALQTG